MLPPFKNADGAMRVVDYTPLATTPRYAGIAVTDDGNVCYSASNPSQFVNGYGVTASGQLSLQAGPIVGYAGGIPRNANGAVVAAFDQVVPASVGWVGGMAVGASGLYVTTGIPPAPPFGTHNYNYIAEPTATAPLIGEVHHGLNVANKLNMRYADNDLNDNKAAILNITTGDTITFNGATYVVTAPTVADVSNTFAYITISPTTQQPSGLYAFTVVAGGVTTPTFGILLENGDFLLLENDNYLVQESEPSAGTFDPFPDDMDNDGLPDTGVLIVGPTIITQDADSINIDNDGDGDVDVVIPK